VVQGLCSEVVTSQQFKVSSWVLRIPKFYHIVHKIQPLDILLI